MPGSRIQASASSDANGEVAANGCGEAAHGTAEEAAGSRPDGLKVAGIKLADAPAVEASKNEALADLVADLPPLAEVNIQCCSSPRGLSLRCCVVAALHPDRAVHVLFDLQLKLPKLQPAFLQYSFSEEASTGAAAKVDDEYKLAVLKSHRYPGGACCVKGAGLFGFTRRMVGSSSKWLVVLRTGLRLSLETLVFTILPVCFFGALLQRVLTTADAVKRTIEVVLQFKEDYAPGDTFCLACPNDTAEVTDLMEQLGCTAVADKQMALTINPATKKKRATVPQHVVGAGTLRECLTALCDLRAPLSKANLCVLAECTAAASERHYLSYLCSRQGSATYMERLQAHGLSAAALMRL